MAVNTSEEYLEELLQSIEPAIHPEEFEEEKIKEEPVVNAAIPETETEHSDDYQNETDENVSFQESETENRENVENEKSGITYENLIAEPDEEAVSLAASIGGDQSVAMSGIGSMVIDPYKKREESSASDSPLSVYNREERQDSASGGVSLTVKKGEVNLAPQDAVDPQGAGADSVITVKKELGDDDGSFVKPEGKVDLTVKTASSIAPMALHSEEDSSVSLSAKKYSGIIAPPPVKVEKNPNILPDVIEVEDVDEAENSQDSQDEEMAMSEEEIDALLNSARETAAGQPQDDQDNIEVSELLKQFSQDEDLSDINSMLEKDSQGELLDESVFDFDDEETADEKEEDREPAEKRKKKKKGIFSFLKRKKENEEEEPEDSGDNVSDIIDMNQLLSGEEKKDSEAEKGVKKKPSLMKKIIQILTEEEDEEEENSAVPEESETGITDENREILEDLSKEEKKKPKRAKKRRKKDRKSSEETGEDEDEEDVAASKGKKKKKLKKEKKAKEKEVEEPLKPSKKLPKKRVMAIFMLCFSILAFLLIMCAVVPGIANKRQAKLAFENAEYETCYANLYGVKRSEKEEEIFRKSEIILLVQRQLDSYHNLRKLGEDVQALDALFEGIKVYRLVQEEAEELLILSRIEPVYQELLTEIKQYPLSEQDIEEIINYESKVAYTKRLESIVNGTPFEWQGLGEE